MIHFTDKDLVLLVVMVIILLVGVNLEDLEEVGQMDLLENLLQNHLGYSVFLLQESIIFLIVYSFQVKI